MKKNTRGSNECKFHFSTDNTEELKIKFVDQSKNPTADNYYYKNGKLWHNRIERPDQVSWQDCALGFGGFFLFLGNPIVPSLTKIHIQEPLMKLLDAYATPLSIFLLKCEKNNIYKSLTTISNKILSLAFDKYNMIADNVNQSTWQVKLFYALTMAAISTMSRYYYINSDEYRYTLSDEDAERKIAGLEVFLDSDEDN
jgi:hypothetical protein